MTKRNSSPVKEYILSQELSTKTKTLRLIELLRIYGHKLGMPYLKKVKGNLFELRILGRSALRILLCFQGDYIFLLHVFNKKTQKIPQKDIQIAVDRMKSII
ncbi:MAG: type II toxin-antitoxin system RelE/ParE family toxin [bacterium]|nr:type II toxin-antitoxin system RelE/ParE family toxin [bacterium]